ncbi:MAG: hypothetical protein M3Q69_20865, partial [Acidobacteriota bacterium]|nr:hypothetical protein [Acidobacteriota bacterium]
GDRPRALRHLRRYLTISEQLAAAHPVSATYQAEVSYAHGNLGVMHEEAGEIDRALAEYRVAADLDRQRVAHEPRNAKWQNDLAISLNRYGALLQMTGALADSEKVFDEELALRRLLVAAAPHDAQRMGRLAVTLGYRGVLQQMMGNTANARASFQEELGLLTTLAALDPTNVSARRNRAVSEARLASLLRDDMPRALAMSGHAVAELREISTKDARPGWRRDLAVIMQRDAALRLAAGDSRAARDEVRQALAVLEPMAAADPRNPQNARTFCQALLTAADAEERIGAPAAARMYRMRAAALAANAQHDPWMTAWRAYALASLGRHDEAARLAAQLLAIGYRDGDIASLVKPPPRTAAAS